jgi:hypothetical protein
MTVRKHWRGNPTRNMALSLLVSLQPMLVHGQAECSYSSPKAWFNGECTKPLSAVVHKVKTGREGYRFYRFRTEEGMRIGQGNWGLVHRDTLFVNFDGRSFLPMLQQGLVCYFQGPPYVSEGERMAIRENYFLLGSIAGALTESDIYAQAKDRIHYVLDTRTERTYLLGRGRMRILLSEHPELLAAFEREAQPPSLEVMLKYIRRLNASAQ